MKVTPPPSYNIAMQQQQQQQQQQQSNMPTISDENLAPPSYQESHEQVIGNSEEIQVSVQESAPVAPRNF
jgi:hypothetical protein